MYLCVSVIIITKRCMKISFIQLLIWQNRQPSEEKWLFYCNNGDYHSLIASLIIFLNVSIAVKFLHTVTKIFHGNNDH